MSRPPHHVLQGSAPMPEVYGSEPNDIPHPVDPPPSYPNAIKPPHASKGFKHPSDNTYMHQKLTLSNEEKKSLYLFLLQKYDLLIFM